MIVRLQLPVAQPQSGFVGVGFAHGFHTPYWVLRSIMHLPNADDSRLVRLYRKFLIQITGSRAMDSLEKNVLNFICPKSLILYAEKPASGAAAGATSGSGTGDASSSALVYG